MPSDSYPDVKWIEFTDKELDAIDSWLDAAKSEGIGVYAPKLEESLNKEMRRRGLDPASDF
jgi:hypothetical protein